MTDPGDGSSDSKNASSWMILHSAESHHTGNIVGVRYRFPTRIPNGTNGLQAGETVVCIRTARDTPMGVGRIFGVGRIGERSVVGDDIHDEVYYDRYVDIDPPLDWNDLGGDPRNNFTNAIVSIPESFFAGLLSAIGLDSMANAPTPVPIGKPTSDQVFDEVLAAAGISASEILPNFGSEETLLPLDNLDVEKVYALLASRDLDFSDSHLVDQAVAALRSGKHLLLQGAPGTGKTSFGEVLAEAARRAGICNGYVQITGSSDWTPSDTVGTYRMNRERELEFVRGQILDAIASRQWVVLDELNRADIDRAMGPLFSVLSGQATALRFEEEGPDGEPLKVAIVPEGQPMAGHRNYEVPGSWRIIATMNTIDLDLLFEVSQAFLRRFAVLTVDCPQPDNHKSILARYATGEDEVDKMVQRLPTIPRLALGPAITLDCARYVLDRFRNLKKSDVPSARSLAFEIFDLFVRPQLANIDERSRSMILDYLANGPTGDAEEVVSQIASDESSGEDEDFEDE
jgi:MoxR-like ATPase